MLPLALMLVLAAEPAKPADAPDEEPPTYIVSLGALVGLQPYDYATTGTTKKLSFLAGARAGIYMRLIGRLGVIPTLNFRFDAVTLRTEWSGQANIVSSLGSFLAIVGAGYGITVLPGERPSSLGELRAGVGMIIGAAFISVDVEIRFRMPEGGRAMLISLNAAWEFPVRR